MNEFVKNVNSGLLNIEDFCKGLILCHGTRTKVKFSKEKHEKNNISFSFDSLLHEDLCIQTFANKCGFSFDSNLMMSQRNCYKITIHGYIEYYPILSMNHSTKNRRRFSILFEKNTKLNGLNLGGLLYIRGSFKHMQNCLKLRNIEKDHLRNICSNLENMGYRVIIYAKKELNPEELEDIMKKFDMAKTNLSIDDEELENLYSGLEQNSSFLTLICFEEVLKEEIKPLIKRFMESGVKIGVFSGDSLSRTLSVVYKAKILDYSKEIMVLEGDNPEKILVGIQALLDHINKNIRRSLEAKEEEKMPPSPKKFKEFCYQKQYSFNYILMFHSSSIELIYNNSYLLAHILFLCYFADGIMGFELSPKDKGKLLKIIKLIPKEIGVLSICNSLLDEKLLKLSECSIEETSQVSNQNKGDLIVSNLKKVEFLLFESQRNYIAKFWLLLSNLVYMNFLLVWPHAFFVIWCGFNPEPLYNFWMYEHFCMCFMGMLSFCEQLCLKNEKNKSFEKGNQHMFKSLILKQFSLAFFDGGLVFLHVAFNSNSFEIIEYELIFLVFFIMTMKFFLNLNLKFTKFLLLIFCNFLLIVAFLMIRVFFTNNVLQRKREFLFFFGFFLDFIRNNFLLLILIVIFIIFNQYVFDFLLLKSLIKEEMKSSILSIKGSEILKIIREIFSYKESDVLIKEIEESPLKNFFFKF